MFFLRARYCLDRSLNHMLKILHLSLGGQNLPRQTFRLRWHSGVAYMRATMFEWIPVESKAMTAYGYDPEAETIYIRFNDGKEWWYAACTRQVWEEFTAPGVSAGKFLNNVLRPRPNGRYAA